MTSVTDSDVPGGGTAVPGGDTAAPQASALPADIAGLVNLRDVGGKSTDDGRRTRSGVLYRSEMPKLGDIDPAGLAWPPATVIDLRSAMERGTDPHPLAVLGADVRVIPLFGDQPNSDRTVAARKAMERGLRALYEVMVNQAGPQIVEILDIAGEAPGPVLIHCAAGKDRTGVSVAVLLRLAGVVEREVLDDYAATGPNMAGVIRRLSGRDILPGSTAGAHNELIKVSPEAAETVLAITEGHPQGVAGWLRDAGASDASITRWRERILV